MTNCLVVKTKLVDMRNIILLSYPQMSNLREAEVGEQLTYLSELNWVGSDIQSTFAHSDW